MSAEEIGREQQYISMLYGRLDTLREQMSTRLAEALRTRPGGTHQAKGERDAIANRCAEELTRYTSVEHGLCFGRLDLDDGDLRYIGRIGMFDDSPDYRPLLIDWRAAAARPFYVATAASPEGVFRRRHLRTAGRTVIGLDDEVLDLASADPNRREGVTGEVALLAAVNASRTGRMHDIVETIQAEQDRIIRSGLNGVLVVQGGPGTGKTAVALHRAAYLLYTYREQLATRAVLLIGPHATFLSYIGQVLPSLGETSVVLATVADLYPGLSARREEPQRVAEIKGRAVMVELLAAAVADRQRIPDDVLEVDFDGETIRIDRAACVRARRRARAANLPHNAARAIFVSEIIDAMASRLAERVSEDILVEEIVAAVDAAVANDPLATDNRELFDEGDLVELRRELTASRSVRAAIDELWPALTPRRLLSDLYASDQRLATAGNGWLSPAELELLVRSPGGGWTPADVPLLDEAAELLGAPELDALAAVADLEESERAEYARGVLEIMHGSRSLDDEEAPEMLMAQDLMDAGRLAARHAETDDRTVAERARADRNWTYGHVIVDEAQELSAMAWRVLMRRCPSRSMTLVGDIAQTGDLAGAGSWAQVLDPYLGDRWRLEPLTVNYRMPAEIMSVAEDVLAALDLAIEPPRSVRETGVEPWRRQVPDDQLARSVAQLVASEVAAIGPGRLVVLAPASRLAEVGAAVRELVPDAGLGADLDLERQVVVLGVRQAKGLEFDSVLIVDPRRIIAESPRGLNDLYVALTRATQRLGVVHAGELPDVLRRVPKNTSIMPVARDL